MNHKIKAQSLVEILIAMAVGAIFIGAATGAVVLLLRNSLDLRTNQIAASLTQEYIDALKSLSESNWRNIYDLTPKGPDSEFYLIPSGNSYVINSGTTSTAREGHTFTESFSAENVNRDSCGVGNITTDAAGPCLGPGAAGITDDPSTQKITVRVTWPPNHSIAKIEYLTRSRNSVFRQTDWAGGNNQEGPIAEPNNKFATSTGVDFTSSTGSIVIEGF